MQIPWKPGGLGDQDPNSYISKITCVSWIRGFWRQLSHPWFVYLDVDRSWSVLKRNFCNVNLCWPLLTFSDNCAILTFFHFHNSVGSCGWSKLRSAKKSSDSAERTGRLVQVSESLEHPWAKANTIAAVADRVEAVSHVPSHGPDEANSGMSSIVTLSNIMCYAGNSINVHT